MIGWNEKLKPILIKYKKRKHPLSYSNLYQLLVVALLSAQESDKKINKISITLFAVYPTLDSMPKTSIEELVPYSSTVRKYKKNRMVN